MIKVGVVGAPGYTGIELCRILNNHPEASVVKLYSQSYAGKSLGDVFPQLDIFDNIILEKFDPETVSGVDVLFLALPHATTHKMMRVLYKKDMKIVDLSADFRLDSADVFKKYYGVEHESPELLSEVALGYPEFHSEKIKNSKVCASPGCYATAVIMGLYPLAQKGLLDGVVVIDAKSGVTGAGRGLKVSSLYCEANENIASYGTGTHRHTAEMEEALNAKVLFSPHLVPMNRGILASMYIDNKNGLTLKEVQVIYNNFYKDASFVTIKDDLAMVSTKYVAGSNKCLLACKVFEDTNKIVIFSAIDNLIKGASGQAIQNMNVMLGLEETTGLTALARYF